MSTSTASSSCFHCGLPVPPGASYSVMLDDQPQAMCCAGCQAVSQAIVDNGLTDFYRFRTQTGGQPMDLIPEQLRDFEVYDAAALQASFVRTSSGSIREAALIMEGIVCAACVWLNERHVRQLPGVLDFRVNYSTHRATLKWDSTRLQLSTVLAAIAHMGYHAHPFDPDRLEWLQKKEKSAALRRIAVAGLGMMQVMMVAIALYIGMASDMDAGMHRFLRWTSLVMATPVVLYSARVFFIAAWRDGRRGQVSMDVPVSLAIGVAYLASIWATLTDSGEVYFDSVTMFTFFLLVGRYLEMMARHRAGQVAEELVRLMPATAHRLTAVGHERVPVSELVPGDRILIKPGETVPADGQVIDGNSSVDESLLTGESLPCQKQPGDQLVGGTLNIESPLILLVQQLGEGTVLASIVRLMERAQTEKPPLAGLADQVASRFVVAILILSLLVFGGWYLYAPEHAFWIMLSVLVVTCPCALSLATPAALTAATGLLTSQGILTTRGHALETLAKVDHLIFDKTGTLTYGQLQVVDFVALGDESAEICRRLAAGLESGSGHPVARAIALAEQQALPMMNILAESGRGVGGDYQQQSFRMGTAAFVQELVGYPPPERVLQAGHTRVWLGGAKGWLAVIDLADRMREEVQVMIADLRQLGVGVSLLSGDAQVTVDAIAAHAGITQAQGAQLPQDKLAYLQQLQAAGKIVAMVGDGVNDAPVLAAAQVSLAMGAGSQLAQASADMVLLSENLTRLPFAIRTARRTQRIIRQNFAWAIGYNLIAIPLAASGMLAPWVSAIGMSASSLVVVLNALRLKR